MTWEIAFVLGLTVCAVVLFVTEKFSTDIVAILVMIVLLVFRVLTPAEGLAGFANTATVTVGRTSPRIRYFETPPHVSYLPQRFSSFVPVGMYMTPHLRDVHSTRIGILLAVRRAVHGLSVENADALANSESLAHFQNLAELRG
jgi:di/tricarboxylate transporter